MKKRIHYAGSLKYVTSDGYTREVLPGWAACCSGYQAIKVRADRNHSYIRAEVDCKSCIRVLEANDRGALPRREA